MEVGKGRSTIKAYALLQAEFRIIVLSATFFLTLFSPRIHMPGHFAPWDVVFSYPEGPLARGSWSPWPYPFTDKSFGFK